MPKITQKDIDTINSQQQQMAINVQALQDIQQVEKQTRMLQQEGLNKAHDTELSGYAGTGEGAIIGSNEVRTAYKTLLDYKKNKVLLEKRLTENEKIWKMNHWEVNEDNQGEKSEKKSKRIKPKSAWLVNTIINKHADAMDNFPEPNVLPRTKDDEHVAKVLTEIVPVILAQNNYPKVYSACAYDKIKSGSSIQGVFWNNDKNNGLGDIDVKNIDPLLLFWKSGITDIQDSPNVFYVTYMDDEELKARYPELKSVGGNGPDNIQQLKNYDEDVDTVGQTAVIDWYYKRRIKQVDSLGIPQTKTVVHYVKFCNEQVLYASENDPNYAETGWYQHGKYPFVFDILFPVKASLCGMGYIDLIADDQIYIDKLQQAILENAIVGARPRKGISNSAGINEEEFLNIENAIVHFDGSIDENKIIDLTGSPLNGIYESVYLQKVQEMKDTSGNTAASQGQTSNVTTASGIASLQEAAGKLSRDSSQESYEAFKEVCYQVIELIRQFYTEERCFRVVGENGKYKFEQFDNRELQPQAQDQMPLPDGEVLDLGSRLPILDVEVRPQKKSAYSKETQNQTALNLYNMGFFAPNNGDAALACLDMMDFDGIEKIRERVTQNATLFMQVQQLTSLLIQFVPEVAAQMGLVPQMASVAQPQGGGSVKEASRGSLASQAANATRESTAPRS
ncbi:portal protein [Pseudobutyrivibrio sp.]